MRGMPWQGGLGARRASSIRGAFLLLAPCRLVQGKAAAWADSSEPRVAGTGSLTLNFWTPYSKKP